MINACVAHLSGEQLGWGCGRYSAVHHDNDSSVTQAEAARPKECVIIQKYSFLTSNSSWVTSRCHMVRILRRRGCGSSASRCVSEHFLHKHNTHVSTVNQGYRQKASNAPDSQVSNALRNVVLPTYDARTEQHVCTRKRSKLHGRVWWNHRNFLTVQQPGQVSCNAKLSKTSPWQQPNLESEFRLWTVDFFISDFGD